MDGRGKPQFYSLLRRRSPQQFVAFDIVWLNGRDLSTKPLIERKRILRSMVPAGSCTFYADFIESEGTKLFDAVCAMDLEGIVAKHKHGLYTPEETSWVKIRNPRYSQMQGRRELFEKRRASTTTAYA